MRQIHVGGDKLFIDYAGQTVPIIDATTGEIRPAQIFVATLCAPGGTDDFADGPTGSGQSFSNPWLVNFSVRLFSVTVRTVCSLAPPGRCTSISSVTETSAPGWPARW